MRSGTSATPGCCTATRRLEADPGLTGARLALFTATVGARYMEAIGLQRPLKQFTTLTNVQLGWRGAWRPQPTVREIDGGIDSELLGYAMSAFYGGRSEARIIRTPVPVVHVDFTSMYPAVNAVLGTWSLLRAKACRTVTVTEEVRELLAEPGQSRCTV